jgi:hypothetical protein
MNLRIDLFRETQSTHMLLPRNNRDEFVFLKIKPTDERSPPLTVVRCRSWEVCITAYWVILLH